MLIEVLFVSLNPFHTREGLILNETDFQYGNPTDPPLWFSIDVVRSLAMPGQAVPEWAMTQRPLNIVMVLV
ncbi:unnamed protein product [Haemonchus placei]|uniref:Maltodextrin glucosidase n=1 Tax=Haemonchus placei TaxID=6290 RepID=A0A0N4WEE7_HAEPC|nr:unnamed protein product [Haemonchus placei]